MRFVLFFSAVALVLRCSIAEAGGTTISVDRVFALHGYLHVLMRVDNGTAQSYSDLKVICDVFDTNGSALGRAMDMIDNVQAGDKVIGEALTESPPGEAEPASAKCRVAD